MNFTTTRRATPFFLITVILAAQTAAQKPILGKVTSFKVHSYEIGMQPDGGEPVFVKFSPDTEVVRIAPGQHDLSKAAPAKITDISHDRNTMPGHFTRFREKRSCPGIIIVS
jgi:hypothetical protein